MEKLGTCYLLPHPPIIVPEIGKGEEERIKETVNAIKEVAGIISVEKPEIVVMITPHGPVFRDAVAVGVQERYVGSFKNFGLPEIKMAFKGDKGISYGIMETAAREGIPVIAMDTVTANKYGISSDLDHGALVPLFYINKRYQKFKLVHITYGMLSPVDLYRLGKCIQQVIEQGEEKAIVISSGDLSHRLTREAPAGYSRRGAEFDEKLVSYLKGMDVENIVNMDTGFIKEAGECGYRSILMLLGALDGFEIESRVLSYEGPFGVGYCVAAFEPVKRDKKREFIETLQGINTKEIERIRKKEDKYVQLARQTLEYYVKNSKVIDIPSKLPEEMLQNQAGVFVSIKKSGQLRGCIGTFKYTTDSIAQEIVNNAISAGTRDPRFYPVEESELKELVYSVDILTEPELVESIDLLDAKKYGVIVRKGRRSGLLLPDLEGVDTPEEQIRIALSKAGISPMEAYTLERFEVIRHK